MLAEESSTHAPSMVLVQTCTLKEKITCADEQSRLFGGFGGGVYRIEKKNTSKHACPNGNTSCREVSAVLVHRHNQPVSFLQDGPGLVLGDWSGRYTAGAQEVPVSSFPIKYIYSGHGYALASDASSLFLVVDGVVASVLKLGTYALHIHEREEHLVCITGYTVHWIAVKESRLCTIATFNIQKETESNETITCFRQDRGRYFCGTIGGWVLEVALGELPGECTVQKLAKVSPHNITDLLLHTHGKKVFFVCTTPNSIHLVEKHSRMHTGSLLHTSLALSTCNGVCAVWEIEQGVFAVLNTNCQVYTVLLPEHIESSSYEDITVHQSTDDIYNELLQSIAAGEM
ncbi:hypothetical protein NECID01_1512 [Nematocida sp. AWRm77]|nr:hypothetical protein NECID01_1512 [Nematocida sp. AWRm77]